MFFTYPAIAKIICKTSSDVKSFLRALSSFFAGFSGNHEVEDLLECSRTEPPPPMCSDKKGRLLLSSQPVYSDLVVAHSRKRKRCTLLEQPGSRVVLASLIQNGLCRSSVGYEWTSASIVAYADATTGDLEPLPLLRASPSTIGRREQPTNCLVQMAHSAPSCWSSGFATS